MNLPRKDKEGRHYLSYSQINCWKWSKQDYYERYILNKPFEGNEYTAFGSQVGTAIEKNDFTWFEPHEQNRLKECTRLDQFERKVELKYNDFYVMGFIDTCTDDMTHIIDYKTGAAGKHLQYNSLTYDQLNIYALAIKQERGYWPEKMQVNFITRSVYCRVEDVPVMHIDLDINENILKRLYWRIEKTAKEISDFYTKKISA